MLTFLFIIGPVWPALAQEVEESNIQIDQGIVVPTEPSAESIEVPVDEPVDLPLTIINEAEKDKNNPKDDKNSDMLETTALMSSSFIGEEVANLQNSIQKSGPKLPEADQSTGALVYKYPLALPDGRNGLQPSIELTYNNQSVEEGSLFGYGWSISIPYIQRLNKHGAEQMYSRNDFTSSLSGELVDLGSGSFSAKVDGGEFMTYTLSSNTWAVKDKKGTMYRFGSTAQGRQDNPADASKIYKWMLEEVRDTNDNFIRYEYFKDQGQIYPSRIIYTGNGTADGPFNIEFSRELRTDLYTNYAGTFAATLRYRINLIQVYQLGLLIRNHQLLYSTGSNGYRSLLASITETGYSESGLSVTKPPVIFAYSQSTPGWAQQQNWSMSYPYANLLRIGNANNDGYLDLLEYHIIEHNPGEPENSIRITDTNNTRTAWWYTGVPPYPPMPFTDRVKGTCGGTGSSDGGTIVDDFNGDYLADMTKAFEYQQYYGYGDWIQVRDAWVNVAGQDWAQTPQWQLSMNIQRRCYPNYSGTTADFNGDGLVDIVGYETYANREVQINNGNGFNTPDPSWISQLGPGPGDRMEELFGRTVDINRDGLADNLQTFVNGQFQEEKHAFMNLGTGSWTDQNNWRLPMMLYMNFDNGYDNGVKFVDINADGLLDLFMLGTERFGGTTKYAYLNTGNGWQQRTDWNLYNPEGNLNAQTHMFDVNADGLVDIAKLEGNVQTYLKTGEVADLLERVTYPEGGNSEVIYKASTQYRLNPNDWNILNPNLPFIVQTVSQIVNNDGFGGNATTTYIYEGGDYYYGSPFDRKFAGFGKITKTDAVGNKAITYFHQGNESNSAQGEFNDHFSKIGRPYRVEQRDSADNLYNVAISKWENVDLGSGRHFVKNTQSVQMAYDGNSTHRDTVASSTYNNTNGNLTQNISWGEVVGSDDGTFTDTGTDKITTDYTYATGGGWGVTGLPATELTTDQSATKVKESRYYYDLLALGSVGKGNLTKQEAWVIGSTYIDTENTYNSYGLVIQTLDGRNKPTSYIYDSYNLYPVTVTNALNQQTQYLYDYSLGKPKQVTDANGAISKTIYDGLDRVVEQKQSDRLTPATLVTSATYVYTYLPVGLQTQETKYLDSTTSVEAYSYTDGLGRAIQSRVEAETPGQFTVSDIVYNSRGLKQKESLPYFSSGSGRTAATSEANLYNTYVYDSAGRVIATTNAVGTVTTTYDDWKTTVTDARGNPKHAYVDAYGRLVKVEEVNGGTYATMYDYNGQGLLIKITDAAGNIRNFTYDGLGRRLTAQDLHAPADATFGTWAYTYDAAGNLLTKLDPKNQNIVYSYDDLNRQLTEDFTGQTGVEVTYAYDNCPRGQGRLCSVTSSALTETREYDALGSTSLEQKTINSTLYTTSYSYDRQGNQVLLTNPDGSQVKNTYNTAGQLEQVQRKEASDADFSDVVTNYNYGPHGQVTLQQKANGTTTNTYDASKLYRLQVKVLTNGTGTRLQDITYTYDANGNITRLVDASQTNSAKTVDYTYDALNRLLTAIATGVAAGQNSYTYTYTYDSIGNILTRTEAMNGGTPTSYTYSYSSVGYANPHAVTNINGVNYTYDNNGNLLSDGARTYTWDYNNRLITANVPGQTPQSVTTSFYPSTGDGAIVHNNSSSWDVAHDAVTGRTASYTSTTNYVGVGMLNGNKRYIERAFVPFNTAALPDDALITDVKLKIYVSAKANNDNDGSDFVTVVQGLEPSAAALTTADYDLAGTVNSPIEGVDVGERKDISGVSTGAYLTFNLNSTGRNWVAKTSFTKLALREGHDVVDLPFVGSKNQYNRLQFRTGEYSGTAYDPVLEVTYQGEPQMDTITYAYDTAGQRVKIVNGDSTTVYPTANYNTDGTQAIKHIMANGVVATVKGTGATAVPYYVATDHLTGSNVVTTSTGIQEELMDYYPFGAIRLDEKAGTFSEQRKFAGQEYDVDTGLSYMNARYYNGTMGRFISEDPLEIVGFQTTDPQKFAALIANPQNWNTYSYALNNPLINVDPSGLTPLTLLLPGTRPLTGDNTSQWVDSALMKDLKSFAGTPVVLFNQYYGWSRANNENTRTDAANSLADFVNNWNFEPGDKLTIFTHSHGGNVVFEALSKMNRNVDLLATVDMPVRNDYNYNLSKVGDYYNFSTKGDLIQSLAGGSFSATGLAGLFMGGVPGAIIGNKIGWYEFGFAGRSVPGAINKSLNVPREAESKNRGIFGAHSAAWRDAGTVGQIFGAIRK